MKQQTKIKFIQFHNISNINPIIKFDWSRFIFPFSSYNRKKYGYSKISVLLMFLDLIIFVIPFSSIVVVLLVNFILNDVD